MSLMLTMARLGSECMRLARVSVVPIMVLVCDRGTTTVVAGVVVVMVVKGGGGTYWWV